MNKFDTNVTNNGEDAEPELQRHRLLRFTIAPQPQLTTTVLQSSRSRTLVCIDWSPSF